MTLFYMKAIRIYFDEMERMKDKTQTADLL